MRETSKNSPEQPLTLVAPVLRRFEWLAQVQKVLGSHLANRVAISLHGYPDPLPYPIYLHSNFGALYPVRSRPSEGADGPYVLSPGGRRLPYSDAPLFPWVSPSWLAPLDDLRPRVVTTRIGILETALKRLAGVELPVTKPALDALARAIRDRRMLDLLKSIHRQLAAPATPKQFKNSAMVGILEFLALLEFELETGAGETFRKKFEKDFVGGTSEPYLHLHGSAPTDTEDAVRRAYKVWLKGWVSFRQEHVGRSLKILGLGVESLALPPLGTGPDNLTRSTKYPSLNISNDCRLVSCNNIRIAELQPETALIFRILLENHMAGGIGLSFKDIHSKALYLLPGWRKAIPEVVKKTDARAVMISNKKTSAILSILPALQVDPAAISWDRYPSAVIGRARSRVED